MLPVEWIILSSEAVPLGKKEHTWTNFYYYFHFMEYSDVLVFSSMQAHILKNLQIRHGSKLE